MKKSITLKELAKKLGVSASTVSKALNDSYEISESTKRKVEAAAKEFNYRPNRAALNLKSGKTFTIGVVLPSIKDFFLVRALRGIESVIANTNYNIVISVTNESYEKEVKAIETLVNGLVDGIILAVSEETQLRQDFDHLTNIPEDIKLLMFDRVENTIECDKVLVDDYEAVLKAVKHLKFKGATKVALVSRNNNLSTGKSRIKGYIDAINDTHDPMIIEGKDDFIERELEDLIATKSINGIIALDEEASLAAFRVASREKLFEERKLLMIGYAGTKISEHLNPSLSTIDQHGKRVGRTTAKILLDKLNNKSDRSEVNIIYSSLCERATTQMVINHQ
ncbi:LacI family DNA-binding transcriptional regulator [Tenacibaculum agarivorans]|uniref:LacI family DNA-binding transcriptional regulator n=1 Tax=Tenacibaculum agarivorans TaxID=1908389 RepID=UPI00094B7BBC